MLGGVGTEGEHRARSDRPGFMQRHALKGLARQARKRAGEPLSPADWEAYWRFGAQPSAWAFKRVLRALPSTPRCGYCGAPFAGVGARLVRPLGYRPSRKNPNICSMCVELAPPGGMTVEIGVLFADLRGFTSASESRTPAEVGAELRRFYAHAEKVFLPEALIDKLIGDEVMALYVPPFIVPSAEEPDDEVRRHIAQVMVEHARSLLRRVGYGTSATRDFKIGIGLDFGEAFIGNIGDSAVHDFTAVGDVVNTASRLQDHAAEGEVVLSARLARLLPEPIGVPEKLALKGKQEPFDVRRVQWFTDPPT
ncbi:MAG TPA: adenylate/guanylate cyclase domain-containing protein [Acidimicrobiales bacterium]|nr:adenylate/guanylate cyclase domain-containing protein [Acidimicrobiales bacterium]